MNNNSHSQHVSTERYDAILQTAESLFAERGYQNVSTEEIARTAGVSKGLVHYHFSSKEELLAKILENGKVVLSSRLESIATTENTARAKMRAAVEAYLEAANSQPALTRMGLITLFEAPYTERLKDIWWTYLEENLNSFASLVEEGISNGEIEPVDSHLITHFVIGMAFEILRVTAFQQKPLEPGPIADEITRVVFNGIAR